MSITESRLKSGTLTLGTEADSTVFACQATNVRLTPSNDDDGDAVETLGGDSIAPGKKESWVLAGSSIQDFDDPEGFLTFCYENAMQSVPFTWQANSKAPTWAGQCVIVALEEGGDVNTRLSTDWEFACAGRPSRTYAEKPAVPPTVDAVDPGQAPAGEDVDITGANLSDAATQAEPAAGRSVPADVTGTPGDGATGSNQPGTSGG